MKQLTKNEASVVAGGNEGMLSFSYHGDRQEENGEVVKDESETKMKFVVKDSSGNSRTFESNDPEQIQKFLGKYNMEKVK